MVVMTWPLPLELVILRFSRFRRSILGQSQAFAMADEARIIKYRIGAFIMSVLSAVRRCALAGLFAAASASSAAAQDYPSRNIRLLVPYGAGGASDVMARYLGQKLGETLGQSVVIDNQPGATGTVAYVTVAKAAPDGYTLGYATSSLAINAVLKPKLGYDALRDFAPISNLVEISNVLIVPASSPWRSVADLIAEAKKRPGELNYVSLGPGSTPHLSAELFTTAAGIKAQHVPYKLTTQAYTDLIENRVQFWIASMPSTLPHVQSGKVRALAVASSRRSAIYPDVQTLIEAGVPAESTFWQGLFAPSGTPPAIIARLNRAVHDIVARPETKEWYGKLGAELAAGTPDQLAALLRNELEKWSKIAKEIGLETN
jgi:tripartite-type tricarboxylate transporter receptor subunit TctC